MQLIRGGQLEATAQKVAAISLSRASRPSAETVAGLVELLQTAPLKTQATYGLGTVVRRLREAGDEQQARETLALVLQRLASADSVVDQVTALRAIANSGHEAAFPRVEPFLSALDAEVRAAAVESLQLMQVPSADSVLGRHLTTDSDQAVRLAAARAIRLRSLSAELERAALSAASSDRDPHVRLAAIRILAHWMVQKPELRARLRELAIHEKEDAIRHELDTKLAAPPTG